MEMTEKVALVTGGSSGIGQAASRRLAQAGVKVGLLGLSEDSVYSATNELQRAGYEILPLVADISSATQTQQAVQKLINQWGRLDIVFANAGINGVWAPLEELTAEDWDKTLNVNLRGTFLTVKYAAPHLKKQGGSVIITASVNGTRMFSNTGATAYACSKAGQVAFTKMIALELAKHKVRVNVICPGAIETEIEESTERKDLDKIEEPVEYPEGAIPLTEGAPGRADQVAELVYFLASDAAAHITGTEMWIDGGQSLLQG
ncbi:MAG: SDR family oxidoreductase [Anaerolineae bacterium]|nr:SDR family oxidoreductase [Anaerolineae bacterium]